MEPSRAIPGHVFVVQGDITQLAAHAVAYSADLWGTPGQMHAAFAARFAAFEEKLCAGYRRALARGGTSRECLELGEAFWIDLESEQSPYGVAVVAAADDTPLEENWPTAGTAVEGAVDCAVAALRERFPQDRLLVALPAFRKGEGDDREAQVESATRQVRAAAEAVGRHPGVDLVFVAYQPDIYQVYAEARRRIPEAAFPGDEPEPPEELTGAIRDREAVLFVGAGLSLGAGLPSWKSLIDELARELGETVAEDDPDQFLDLAERFRRSNGETLPRLIRERFGSGTARLCPTLAHYFLLSLPFCQIITTNYDTLIERTLRALRRYPVRVVRQEEVAATGRRDAVFVIKLHGDAEHDPHDLVLTREDYDRFFERRPAMAALLQGLLLNQSFFFVGYSLRDPDFLQVYSYIADILRGAQRTAYATAFRSAGGTDGPDANGQLLQVRIEGRDAEDQNLRWLRFLDRLSEAVSQKPTLFLAWNPDSEGDPEGPIHGLRETLRRAGELLEEAAATELLPEQVPQLARILEALTEHGWRPASGAPLWKVWKDLALQAESVSEQRRLLSIALAYTESYDDAEAVHRMLDELHDDANTTPDEPVPGGDGPDADRMERELPRRPAAIHRGPEGVPSGADRSACEQAGCGDEEPGEDPGAAGAPGRPAAGAAARGRDAGG